MPSRKVLPAFWKYPNIGTVLATLMNVVDGERAECAEPPGDLPGLLVRPETAAQPRFEGMRHHLLERRIGDQEIVDHAGCGGAGTAELQWRRGAVGFGIAPIGGDVRGDLVGRADHRIEMFDNDCCC